MRQGKGTEHTGRISEYKDLSTRIWVHPQVRITGERGGPIVRLICLFGEKAARTFPSFPFLSASGGPLRKPLPPKPLSPSRNPSLPR